LPSSKKRDDSIERKICDDLEFLGLGENVIGDAVGNRAFKGNLSGFKG
jgi:hypothetical protein